MRIWILNVGENMPTDPDSPRLLRCGILANYLADRGHEVVWWSSTFDHYLKKHRFDKDTAIQIRSNYVIKYLYGGGYKRNVSLKRLYDHYVLGKKFYRNALSESVPDIIITSYPIMSFSEKAVKYGVRKNIPVVVDARDMWPDIFLDIFPERIKPLAEVLLRRVFRKTNYIFKHAAAITGMTDSFVEWGLKKANRIPNSNDISFPFGYEKRVTPVAPDIEKRIKSKINIDGTINIAVVAYLGSVLDVDLIASCAREIKQRGLDCNIIICGDGERFDEVKALSGETDKIKLLGWCNADEISALMNYMHASFIPYVDRLDFRMSIPNKVPEYLSFGLPVITSLPGEVKKLVLSNDCGFFTQSEVEFCDVVESIIEAPERVQKMAHNAQLCFDRFFDSTVVYNEMCDYLERIDRENNTVGK